jgi:hypothetical protein
MDTSVAVYSDGSFAKKGEIWIGGKNRICYLNMETEGRFQTCIILYLHVKVL